MSARTSFARRPAARLALPARLCGGGLAAVALALSLAAAPALALSLPPGAGLATVRKECTRCHSLINIPNSGGKTREGWETHVIRMTDIERRPDNLKAVVDYLTEHFPPESAQN
jgi:hypothetical protein